MNTDIIDMARVAGSIDSEDVILTVYNAFGNHVADERLEQAAEVLEHAGEFAAAEVVRGLKS